MDDLEAGDIIKVVPNGKDLRLVKLSTRRAAEIERNIQLLDFSRTDFHTEPVGADGGLMKVSIQFIAEKQFVDSPQELCQFYDNAESRYIKYAMRW